MKGHNVETIDVNSWEEFEDRLRRLENERTQYQKETGYKRAAELLFRGQSNHSWGLTTTLERAGKLNLPLREYHGFIYIVKPSIETVTGLSWDILNRTDFENQVRSIKTHAIDLQTYAYMVYLRHHGFPSPLLDWTKSPYVAAYFSFSDVNQAVEKVSIFVYCEWASGSKTGSIYEPQIESLDQDVKNHRRHFLQQSDYTICTVQDGELLRYAPHEEAFARADSHQNLLWKFNIPSKERLKVLKLLDRYNLNDFSLFGSEESLLKTLALKTIHFPEINLN